MSQPGGFHEAGERIRVLRGAVSQVDFAARLDVDRKSVAGWETGKRLPDGSSLLRLVTEYGADLNYLLTGHRTSGEGLAPDERVVLENYRRCVPQAKAALLQTSALLAAGIDANAPRAKASKHNQTNSGAGAIQIGKAAKGVSIVGR